MSDYRKYVCKVCGHVYDEAEGDPEHGYPPGTRWDMLPDTWTCPECGASKDQYEPMPVST